MAKNIFMFSYDKKLVKNHKVIKINMPVGNNQDTSKHTILKKFKQIVKDVIVNSFIFRELIILVVCFYSI